MSDPRAGGSAAVGAVEAALLALAAPGRRDLAPPHTLPPGAIDLIRVAAEDRSHAEALADRFGVSIRQIEDAALYFVHSVMFHPDSDHFRVLGVRPDDDEETLKLHFRWLQKWLHPDRDPEGWVSVYAERVNIAWAQLRRADRRAEYRQRVTSLEIDPDTSVTAILDTRAMDPASATGLAAPALISSHWARRLPILVIGGGLVFAVSLFAAHRVGENLLAAERGTRDRTGTAALPVDGVSAPEGPIETGARAGAAGAGIASNANTAEKRQAGASAGPGALSGSVQSVAAGLRTTSKLEPLTLSGAAGTQTVSLASSGRQAPDTMASQGQAPSVAAPSVGVGQAAKEVLPDVSRSSAALRMDGIDRSSPRIAVALQPKTVEPAGLADNRAPAGSGESMAEVATASPSNLVSDRLQIAAASQEVARSQAAPAGLDRPSVVPSPPGTHPALVAETDRSASMFGGREPASVFDPSVGRRVLNQFSSAYRDGQVQQVVVLFAPNARTPEGNLVDLHQRYRSLFAASSRRSLEFVDLEWRQLPNGLEAVGRYEWAMRPHGIARTQATSGRMRVVIEFVDGRPLIVLLDQRDVG